jgi:flagellar biosynthetic protein FliR
MNDQLSRMVMEVALVYCRIGPCVLFLPGFGHAQIPRSVRGLISVVLAVAISRVVSDWLNAMTTLKGAALIQAVAGEVVVGLMFGLAGRLVLSVIETFGSIISASVGLSANLGVSLDTEAQGPVFSTLCSLLATLAVIASDAHLAMIRGLVASYKTLSVTSMEQTAHVASYVVDCLVEAFKWGLALAAPFVLAAATVNVMLMVMGKIMPQLQIFFISTPILIGCAFLMMQGLGPSMLEAMLDIFEFAVPMQGPR